MREQLQEPEYADADAHRARCVVMNDPREYGNDASGKGAQCAHEACGGSCSSREGLQRPDLGLVAVEVAVEEVVAVVVAVAAASGSRGTRGGDSGGCGSCGGGIGGSDGGTPKRVIDAGEEGDDGWVGRRRRG